MRLVGMVSLFITILLNACMGPHTLPRSVLNYDNTISRLESEMLLNIVRLDVTLPPHFTVASSVAATFNWTATGGVAGRFDDARTPLNRFDFSLGASASENPTFSIVPVTGKEFTERFLTPIPDEAFEFVIFQGARIDRVMRLVARGVEIQKPDGSFDRFILNQPKVRHEYEEFRRIAMHLKWLNDSHKLHVRTIQFEETLLTRPPDKPPTTGEVSMALDKNLAWRQMADGSPILTRKVAGRVAVTNYDPSTISNEEREKLNDLAARNPSNVVLLDIRPGHTGGDWPMFGGIKLRSFGGVLDFIASTINKNPEFDVAKDPRTGPLVENPRNTLAIQVTDSAPSDDKPWVNFRGRHYSVGDTDWDRRGFILLSTIFQTTVTDVSGVGLPITISK